MSDTTAEAPAVSINDIVERYIALRDKKAQFKAEYDAKVEAVETALGRCEAFILGKLDEMGAESIRTPAGTAYVSHQNSATAADWDAYLTWVRANDAWSGIDKRVNKSFVESYKEQHNDLPPGVNWRSERKVNFRRS